MDRFDILTVRESNGKSYFTKLGAMFPNKSGEGFTIVLDAVPASVDGQYRLIAKAPQPRDDRQQGATRQQPTRQQHRGGGGRGPQYSEELEDDAPFMSCDPALEHRVR